MAQNTWINLTIDPNTGVRPESLHNHTVSGGTAAAGDVTFSFDSAKLTNGAQFESVIKAIRVRCSAGGLTK